LDGLTNPSRIDHRAGVMLVKGTRCETGAAPATVSDDASAMTPLILSEDREGGR
jgi:hypothetical protein